MADTLDRADPAVETRLALGEGHVLEVIPRPQAALVTVRSPGNQVLLSFEVVITPAGAVVRGQAAALEIEAARVATHCDEFLVDARDRIELRSRGTITQQAHGVVRVGGSDVDVQSTAGAVRLRANDDVQLLGEQVLLNCDRPAPMPAWTAPPARALEALPRADHAGDAELVKAVGAEIDRDAAG